MADAKSNPKHTPGPWAWDSRNGDDYLVSCASDTPHIVVLGFMRDRLIPADAIGDADRALIAAAPCLLAALKALTEHSPAPLYPLTSEYGRALKAADAAIAKTEGQ